MTIRSSSFGPAARSSALLLAIVAAGAAAACGPAGDGAQGPGPQPPTTATATGSAPIPPAPPASASAGPNATKPPETPAAAPMKPIVASAMEADLKAIGIDARALPALNKLEPDKLRKVMKVFAKSLGVQCSHCHDTKDFRAPTANKKVAMHMWNDFTRALVMDDKTVLFCDSCHQGHATFLDRKDMKALAGWMDANFEHKLSRADKKEHNCGTCHGDPFEGKIFTKLWKSQG